MRSYVFREPDQRTYRVEEPVQGLTKDVRTSKPAWLKAWPEGGTGDYVKFGNRIVLELGNATDLANVLAGSSLKVTRTVASGVHILEGPDTPTALKAAALLAEDHRVAACYPVAIRPKRLNSEYAPMPSDPYFYQPDRPSVEWQPYLENRGPDGRPLGIDLNVRAAWAISRGTDVLIAIGDDGIELSHPDLVEATKGNPHFNFYDNTAGGNPAGPLANHGTAVAGLAAARGNNRIGISGVAPEAKIASWVLFSSQDRLETSDEALMDMFQYRSNVVSVQNHSWGKDGKEQYRVSTIENLAISNAVVHGRSGKGVIIVRAGGNGRLRSLNANDDGYLADPRAIAVAAARLDGRVARYSAPGANLLVAALSGDVDSEPNPCGTDLPNLMTTDRRGTEGYNFNSYTNDLADYAFGPNGFSGTSAASPQIAGLAALILGANPELGYRDVQQILIHSARHYDLADPDIKTNAAGFRVSHNLGFGIPDAGMAVRLAKNWPKRPALTNLIYSSSELAAIPNEALRLILSGKSVPATLQSITALPGTGPMIETSSRTLPMVDVGTTANGITANLNGRAALIQRGENYFCEKLSAAAAAGAEFAVIYNNRDLTSRLIMGATDFSPIPGVFINQLDGEALRELVKNDPELKVQITHTPTHYTFNVREALLCEHVGVRIDTDHTARGDVRITLQSPQGTRSVLQSVNNDESAGPRTWTYYSTHHFYESSAGNWTVSVSDLDSRGRGNVRRVTLLISGVAIIDSDRDGLDDQWELRHFKSLSASAKEDPDEDGYCNAREQVMNTDPLANETPFRLDFSPWNTQYGRLSWPSNTNFVYEVRTGGEAASLMNLVTTLPGKFPVTEWFVPYTNWVHQFFRVESASPTTQSR